MAVVTDSTSSLRPCEAVEAQVAVIPLQVVIDDESRPESEVDPCEVATALRAGRRVSTSRPTPEVIGATYAQLAREGFDAIVSVHLSAAISGTCGAAQVAAAGAQLPVTVVDSRTVALGTGFAVLAGARAGAVGASAAEVADLVTRQAAASTTFFYVDSLEYLRRGGRIGTAAAMVGSALAVKPLLTVAEGRIQAYERVRTESKALARLAELGLAAWARAAGGSAEVDVAVHHLDNPAGAARLRERLQGRLTDAGEIVVAELSAVLGVHTGPGTLGVVVAPRLPR